MIYYTDHIDMAFLHCVFLDAESREISVKMIYHIGCIDMVSRQYVFSDVKLSIVF